MKRSFWTLTLLAARRDWHDRVGARSYRITTVILILAVVLAVAIPALVSGSGGPTQVGVVASGARLQTAAATVQRVGRVLDVKLKAVAIDSLSTARARLRSGAIAVAYVPGSQVTIHQRPGAGGNDTDLRLADAIAQLGSGSGSGAAAAPAPTTSAGALPVHALQGPPPSLATRLTGLVVSILIYLIVFVYGQRITSGVVEEKSTRVAEVLLASMRPAQLLVGKVLGIGASALAQVLALVVAFFIAAEVSGSSLLHGAAIDVVLVGAVWLLLGYALHCTAFAAAGSLVSRESEASNVVFPVIIPLLVAYALSFSVIFGASGNAFYHVLAFIPPCAPIASTVEYAVGAIGLGQVAISWVISIVATGLCVRVAATIYERSILRTGPRLHLRDVLGRRAASQQ